MKKLFILALLATVVSFSACTNAAPSKEEEKKEDSTAVETKVDTTSVKVDTASAKH